MDEDLLKEAINDFDMAKASAGRKVSFSYWFRDEITKALTQAHQAGIDEAVALLKEKRNGHCGKEDCLQAYCINRKIIREFCDDTIKALQDNK